MNFKHIFLITKREYLSRVKRKLFLILTIITPLFLILIFFAPIYFAQDYENSIIKIAVVDSSGILQSKNLFGSIPQIEKYDKTQNFDSLVNLLKQKQIDGILVLQKDTFASAASLYTIKKLSDFHLTLVKQELKNLYVNFYSDYFSLPPQASYYLLKPVVLKQNYLTEKSTSKDVSIAIGSVLGILLYFFIFMYSSQIMHSAKEEKRNRIVEVIVSSVKPVNLLTGKILGITLVALTQIFIWLVIGFGGLWIGKYFFSDLSAFYESSKQIIDILEKTDLTFFLLISGFYFLFGYLIYGLWFAVVGASVDNDSDMQQFLWPITLPLILSVIMMQNFIQSPESQLSFWFSIIPFTSPVAMPVLIGSGYPELIPLWQILLSMFLLVITFVGVAYISGKIYRIGILMYGKKITYRELLRWLKQS